MAGTFTRAMSTQIKTPIERRLGKFFVSSIGAEPTAQGGNV